MTSCHNFLLMEPIGVRLKPACWGGRSSGSWIKGAFFLYSHTEAEKCVSTRVSAMKGQKPVELLTAVACVALLNSLSGGGGGAGKVMQHSLFSRKRGAGFQRLHAGYSSHSLRPFTGQPESGGMLIKDATVKPAQRSSLKAGGGFLGLSVCCAEVAEDPLWRLHLHC